MPGLILPARLARQPDGMAVIDTDHPSARGLASFIAASPRALLLDYAATQASVKDPFNPGSSSFTYTGLRPQGRFRNTDGGSFRNTLTLPGAGQQAAIADQYTLIALLRPISAGDTSTSPSTATTSRILFADASGTVLAGVGVQNSTYAGYCGTAANGLVVADAPYTVSAFTTLAYTADYAAGVQRLIVNNQRQAATAAYTGAAGKTFNNWAVYAYRNYSEFYAALFFTRVLSDSEIADISRNPWQLLATPGTRLISLGALGGATPAPANGALTATLRAATLNAAVAVAVAAGSASTLAPATLSASLAAQVSAGLSATLAPAGLQSTALNPVAAAVSAALAPASLSADAGAQMTAGLSATLGPATIAGSGSALAQASMVGQLGSASLASDVSIILAQPPVVRATGLLCVMRRPATDRVMHRQPPTLR